MIIRKIVENFKSFFFNIRVLEGRTEISIRLMSINIIYIFVFNYFNNRNIILSSNKFVSPKNQPIWDCILVCYYISISNERLWVWVI